MHFLLKVFKNKVVLFQIIFVLFLYGIFIFQMFYNHVNKEVSNGVEVKMKIVDKHASVDNIGYASEVYFNIDGKTVFADITEETKFENSSDVTEGVVYLIETTNLDLNGSRVIKVLY